MSETKVALYWDFENVHACVLEELRGAGSYRATQFKAAEPIVDLDPVVEYAATFGDIVINRAYCNWQWMHKYRSELQAHAVDLVQMFPLTATKNGADIRLAIDVMEDQYQQRHITHVVVVSGDSDYVGLAQKCRKLGSAVIGVGVGKSNKRLIASYDEFRYYRDLAGQAEGVNHEAVDAAGDLIARAIRSLATGRGEPWVPVSAVRRMVLRLDPAFSEASLGAGTFEQVLDRLGEMVERGSNGATGTVAVAADLGASPIAVAAGMSSADSSLVARQLRKIGIKLPPNREIFWAAPDALAATAAEHGAHYSDKDGLLEAWLKSVQAHVPQATDTDMRKLRSIFIKIGAITMHGDGAGYEIAKISGEQLLRRALVGLIVRLPEIEDVSVAGLTEALSGLVGHPQRLETLRMALDETRARVTADATGHGAVAGSALSCAGRHGANGVM